MSEEPVFVRSKWGTNRYVYNVNNPVGRALIVLALLVAGGVLFGLRAESTWSEGELRDAVRKGVADLDGTQHYTSLDDDHGSLIAEAIRKSGIGPGHGVDTEKEESGGYTVSTKDTETAYCVRVTLTLDTRPDPLFPQAENPPPSDPDMPAFYLSTATSTEGPCP
ncbi:hypothetical protein SLA_6444 [Streptomyces laurentii]|uniref:Uncharacterized protein n=1 Tax=Streptomyces laurentii TaxID=39478 RepID=A0A160P842_STRLU|nr:hypothetical protein SLA_6444 [Streptomyces laurentii]